MTSVLLFGAGIPPIDPAMPVSGDGLRIWQLYQGLKSKNFDVHLSLYKPVYNSYKKCIPEDIGKYSFDYKNQDNLIKKVEPDVIIFQDWPTIFTDNQSITDDIPVVVDFHSPHILERLYTNNNSLSVNLSKKIQNIKVGDFFTCAGEYQKYYFTGFLLSSGLTSVVNEKRISTIPFSLDPKLPEIQYELKRKERTRILFSGMFHNWQDSFSALKTISYILRKRDYDAELNIISEDHPLCNDVQVGKFNEIISLSKNNPEINYHGLVNRERLLQEFKHTHIAVDLTSWSMERELALPSLSLEYLWAGIPVIYNNYTELSDYIKLYEAGWCVDPSNLDNWINTIDDVHLNHELLIEYAENAQRLVKSKFTWDISIDPLERFCRNPSKRDYTQDVSSITESSLVKRSIRCYRENGLLYSLKKGLQLVKGS